MSSIKRLCMLETNEFLSYQPYLELNNNYQSYVPIEHNIIRDIVWEVYEVDDFDLGKTVALPDVCADIMTFYTDDNAYSFFYGRFYIASTNERIGFYERCKEYIWSETANRDAWKSISL